MNHLAGLFGRASDVSAVEAALARTGRCVVVGPGGVGKSTLARAVADSQGGPTAWVDAEPLENIDSLARAVLDSLSIDVLPGDHIVDLLTASIADCRTLVVIDGAERLAPALAALVESWSTSPDGPRLIVTCRVPLGRSVVPVVRLTPLTGSSARPEDSEAGAMMRACVDALGGDSAALTASRELFASLLESTGGLPLAIELVSTRIVRFGLEFVAVQPLAFDEVVERCVDRTLGLLDADDVALFRRLGLTGGAGSIAVLAGVAGQRVDVAVAGIGRLCDHGLVQPADGGRFDLLPPIREVARRQLQRGGSYESVVAETARWAFGALGGADRREDPAQQRLSRDDLDEFVHLAWAAIAAGCRMEALDLIDVLFVPLADRLRGLDTLALLEAALADAVDITPAREAASAVRAAICASECDTIANAERWLDRAERAAEMSADTERLLSQIWSIRAFVAFDEGQLGAAQRHAERSVELARRCGESFTRNQSLRNLADCAMALGDLDRAEALSAEVLDWARGNDLYTEFCIRVTIGWCLLERGQRDEAAASAQTLRHEIVALEGFAKETGLECELLILAAGSAVVSATGPDELLPNEEATSGWAVRLERRLHRAAGTLGDHDPQAVIQTAADVAVLAGLVPLARVRIAANLLLGRAALSAGDRRQASVAYEQALRDAMRGPYRLRCADALDGLAAVADATNVPASALHARALADAIRARCGAAGWVQATRSTTGPGARGGRFPARWMRDGSPAIAGVDELMAAIRRPADPGSTDSLTRAEQQISELVAAGLTNNEIAARLYISRRTVETHLTHIFRKLELRTRTQLAALHLRLGAQAE